MGDKRFYMDAFGLSGAEADEMLRHHRHGAVADHVADWALAHGVSKRSPLARGYLMDILSGKERVKLEVAA